MTTTELATLLEKGVASLLTHGFGIIPFQLYPGILNGISQDLLRFCAEPMDYKLSWAVDRELGEDADNGYILKEGKLKPDGITRDDEKEYLHIRLFLRDKLERNGVSTESYLRLLSNTETLWRVCESTLSAVAEIIDRLRPGWNCSQQVHHPAAIAGHVVRLVAYTDTFQKRKEVIGKPHTDKQTFVTIHILESYDGLRLYLPSGEKMSYRTQPGTALIFFGDSAEKMTSGQWKALQHDVEDVRVNRNEWQPPRWSIIFFGHSPA